MRTYFMPGLELHIAESETPGRDDDIFDCGEGSFDGKTIDFTPLYAKLLDAARPYHEYISIWGKQNGLRGIVALYAKAVRSGKFGEWGFYDRGTRRDVQGWIDEQDGKHAGITVLLEQRPFATPRTKRSALLMYDGMFQFIPVPKTIDTADWDGDAGRDCFAGCDELLMDAFLDGTSSIILPGGQEIDDYTIAHELKRLKINANNNAPETPRKILQ